jgi:hypothetical protein
MTFPTTSRDNCSRALLEACALGDPLEVTSWGTERGVIRCQQPLLPPRGRWRCPPSVPVRRALVEPVHWTAMPDFSWTQRNGISHYVVRDGNLSDVYLFLRPHQPPTLYCTCDESNPLGTLAKALPGATFTKAKLAPGEFHSRMWRGQPYVRAIHVGLGVEERQSLRVARMLTAGLQEIFRFLEPTEDHDDVYSHELPIAKVTREDVEAVRDALDEAIALRKRTNGKEASAPSAQETFGLP